MVQKSTLEKIQAKLGIFKFLFHYKTPKYIKVDVPAIFVLFHVCNLICVFGALFAPLYFQDAWALTETPGGTVNAWDSPGTMEAITLDDTLATRTPYCSSESHSYAEGDFQLESPDCMALLPGELTEKSTASAFFTTAYMETVTIGWPCAGDANETRKEGCEAGGGFSYRRRNGQCGCVSQQAVYPLAVEQMIMGFEHAYDTGLLGQGWSALSNRVGNWLASNSSALPPPADTVTDEEQNDGAGIFSMLQLANGSTSRYEAGEPLELSVADWLRAANISLETLNDQVSADSRGRRVPLRSSGVTVRVEVEYSNRDPVSGRAVIGNTNVHADVSLRREVATWTGVAKQTTWVISPALPRSNPSEYYLVERWRYGVKFEFVVSGRVYRLDFFVLLGVVLSAVVAIGVSRVVADAVSFYMLPNGQSTILRNKRQELVSRKSEFAELGMKAALAARIYRNFDPDNNGCAPPALDPRARHEGLPVSPREALTPSCAALTRAARSRAPFACSSIEPVDIVRAFAKVSKADGSPWVDWETSHSIAHMILSDADTDADQAGGQVGLSFVEFMTCLEGDSIDFEDFLKNVRAPKTERAESDREACRIAFEEEKAGVEPVVKTAEKAAPTPPTEVPPPTKLNLSAEEKTARLERRGVLTLHLQAGFDFPAKDANGLADPYVLVRCASACSLACAHPPLSTASLH